MQSRKLSLIESLTNVAVGFAISLISQVFIFSAYGVALSLSQNVAITCWFTLISIVRSYCLRRAFNRVREREPRECSQRPPKAPPPPPEAVAAPHALSDAEICRLRAAAGIRGPSL